MRVDYIKSNLRNIELLGREYKENVPKDVEDEIDQLKAQLKSGLKITSYDKRFLTRFREIKRETFKQILYWAVKMFNEIDDSVSVANIENIDQNKVDVLLKEISAKEADLLGLLWELLFRIDEPKEPFEKIIAYTSDLPIPSFSAISNINDSQKA